MDRVQSVAELIERTKDMPLERMRFFINEDRREPRCFGIYHDDAIDRWIVYKNKSDGSRAVRYSGPDEAFAAQELWAKIQSEIEKRRPAARKRLTAAQKRSRALQTLAIAVLAAVGLFLFVRWMQHQPDRGYYEYKNRLYYYQNDDWYYFDDGWYDYGDDLAYEDWSNAEYYGTTYDGFDSAEDAFESSGYYVEPSSDDEDSDIFDSWDSGDTDWDSDW